MIQFNFIPSNDETITLNGLYTILDFDTTIKSKYGVVEIKSANPNLLKLDDAVAIAIPANRLDNVENFKLRLNNHYAPLFQNGDYALAFFTIKQSEYDVQLVKEVLNFDFSEEVKTNLNTISDKTTSIDNKLDNLNIGDNSLTTVEVSTYNYSVNKFYILYSGVNVNDDEEDTTPMSSGDYRVLLLSKKNYQNGSPYTQVFNFFGTKKIKTYKVIETYTTNPSLKIGSVNIGWNVPSLGDTTLNTMFVATTIVNTSNASVNNGDTISALIEVEMDV